MSDPELVTPELLRGWALPDPGGSKQARGRVVVVGGAAGTPGGVALAGLAALRVGAGHVQLAVAESVAPSLAAGFPEAGVIGLPQTGGGSVAGRAAATVCAAAVGSADAVLIGPGLDDADEAAALLEHLLPAVGHDAAVVLDAYSLGVLPDVGDRVSRRPTRSVLTPNVSELSRLLGRDCEGDLADVAEAAERFSCCVTAQGIVADRGSHAWRVPLGHAGLATAGSGDVLAGLVVGLLAREAEPPQAACWGTYLHAMAGERLASAVGGVGFLARELVDEIPRILAELD